MAPHEEQHQAAHRAAERLLHSLRTGRPWEASAARTPLREIELWRSGSSCSATPGMGAVRKLVSLDEGHSATTMKIKRRAIDDKYGSCIQGWYDRKLPVVWV